MTTERLAMRHTREILRQKFTLSRSHRAVAQSLGISSGAVGATALRARAAGLDWPQVEALTDDALAVRLYGLREVAGSRGRPSPDWAPTCTPSAASLASPWSCSTSSTSSSSPTGIATPSSARSIGAGSAAAA